MLSYIVFGVCKELTLVSQGSVNGMFKSNLFVRLPLVGPPLSCKESQWEPPPELEELHQQYVSYYQAQYQQQPAPGSNSETTALDPTWLRKRKAEEASLEEPEEPKRPERLVGPYGAWTTVAVRYAKCGGTEGLRLT